MGSRRKGHIHSSYDFGTEITYWCTESHTIPNRIAKQYKRLRARVLRLRRQWKETRRAATFRRIERRVSKFPPPEIGNATFTRNAKTTGARLVEILGPDAAENLTDAQLHKIADEASHFRQETGTRPAILNVNTDDHS